MRMPCGYVPTAALSCYVLTALGTYWCICPAALSCYMLTVLGNYWRMCPAATCLLQL